MRKFATAIVLSLLMLLSVLGPEVFAQDSNVTEAEAKMFAASAGYERFMGRWSRLLAPAYIAFAGIKNGDRVLDVGFRAERKSAGSQNPVTRSRMTRKGPRPIDTPNHRS